MTLDIRTILVLFILNNLVIGTLFAVAFRGRRTRATDLWIASLAVQSIGWLVFVARGNPPGAVSIVLAGTLISLSYSLLLHAFCEFFEFSVKPLWIYLPVALTVIIFESNLDNAAARNLASGLIFGVQFLAAAALFLTRRDRWRNLRFLIGISAAAIAFLFIARSVIAFTDPGSIPVFPENSPLQTVTLLVGDISRLAFSFGFLLLIEARRSDEITRLATLDSLTEAYNRRTFIELAEQELARTHRHPQPLGLIILDLDHFKQVNDTHGHLAGDAALKHVKVLAERCLRQQDTFARFGGEEFCVLVPDTDMEGVAVLAERLRKVIADTPLELPNGTRIPFTTSVGACAMPEGMKEAGLDNLIEFADLALYEAKKQGRNRVVVENLANGLSALA
ncbi:MAG: GGDEF domain-containing protein [Sulfuricella sp.]|nr:GGDEF domain-containing protein [Sulfuricella sp.]